MSGVTSGYVQYHFRHAIGGRPWNPNTTARRFKRCCAEVGLPDTTRLHDLRHLMATYLIDKGVPIPVVSARLGYFNNTTTIEIYTGRDRPANLLWAHHPDHRDRRRAGV